MSHELLVILTVVVPDGAGPERRLHDLRGRELPGVPGSWVTRVGVRTLESATAPAQLPTLASVDEHDDLSSDDLSSDDLSSDETPLDETDPERDVDPGDADRP